MADRYPSIYQRARKDACLTQEQAAELLSVSVETVKAWEQRQRVPRPEDVERMQAAYGTPWLGLEYTRATCGQLGGAAGAAASGTAHGGAAADQPGHGAGG